MIDLNLLRQDPDFFVKASKSKNIDIDINHILKIDANKQVLQKKLQKLQEERNVFNKTIKGKPTNEEIEKGKELRNAIEIEERAFSAIDEELNAWLLKIPNPPKKDVKIGKDDSQNQVLKKWGEPRKFDFKILDHLEIGEKLDLIDVKNAAEISGSRFGYLKNEGALLEFALKQLAFETLVKKGFIPIIPPVIVKKEIMDNLGYTQMGEDENIYEIKRDNLYLVGTSEQSIVPLLRNKTLKLEDLPHRYVGFSTCFRREAGTYGKDAKGIFRVHEFDKVEMISYVAEGDDDREHEYLLSLEEDFFQMLNIPYQVVAICSGDLGFNAARKYDIEAWIPSQNKYREVTSTSTTTDFQARRLNMKYFAGQEKKYLQVLNGTVFSMNRPIIAILENYQQKDGSVEIPEILQKYIGKKIIKANS